MVKIVKTIRLIEWQIRKFTLPSVTRIARKKDAYRILISCILSLRTKDKTTIEASKRLFRVADKPESMIELSVQRLQRLIYPVGFYRIKSKVILEASKRIVKDFSGTVPARLDELLTFKGVGRKTANLVLGLGFGIPAICVDTHVHRISNRLGWIKTRTPEDTEDKLMALIPKKEWIGLNTTLVTFGQNICLPLFPLCSLCKVYRFCKRVKVNKHS